jgi:hypothetical protein
MEKNDNDKNNDIGKQDGNFNYLACKSGSNRNLNIQPKL